MHFILSVSLLLCSSLLLEAKELWKSNEPIANSHIKANYKSSESGIISFSTGGGSIALKTKDNTSGIVEFAASQKVGSKGRLKAWINGEHVGEIIEFENQKSQTGNISKFFVSSDKQAKETFDLSKDFTTYVRFKTKGNGTLFSKAAPDEKWIENGKVLYIDEGRLVYDIGWKGQISGGKKVNDNQWHEVLLVTRSGNVKLFLDGKLIQSKKDFAAKTPAESIFQIGKCSIDFGGNFDGNISNVRHWKRALNDKESLLAVSKKIDETNTPDFNWKPISKNNDPTINQTQPSVINGFVANIAKIKSQKKQR